LSTRAGASSPEQARVARDAIERLVANVERVIRGKDDVVRLVVTALLARGHVLVEDVPGVGKTTLAACLARSVSGAFRRIQFTSDLLPSDILGVNVWSPERRVFEFHPGPIFANLVLADEINRTTPKTQSALLEAMSEGTVTIDDRVHALPDPFLVVATQNPIEHAGTFPLPDSQLDRFLLRTRMGYPDPESEVAILTSEDDRVPEDLSAVLGLDELRGLREAVDHVRVHPDLARYLVDLVGRTRGWDAVLVGASPRASRDLYRAARARAFMAGRDHVTPDDVKALAASVLVHRLVPRDPGGGGERLEALLLERLESVPVPL
jgi:MoxR-like ATPase